MVLRLSRSSFADDWAGAVDFLFFGEQQRGSADFENVHDLRREFG